MQRSATIQDITSTHIHTEKTTKTEHNQIQHKHNQAEATDTVLCCPTYVMLVFVSGCVSLARNDAGGMLQSCLNLTDVKRSFLL